MTNLFLFISRDFFAQGLLTPPSPARLLRRTKGEQASEKCERDKFITVGYISALVHYSAASEATGSEKEEEENDKKEA